MTDSTPKNTRTLPCGRIIEEINHHRGPKNFLDCTEKLKNYLAKNGLKSSKQRDSITQVILTHPGHFNIQDISKIILQQHPTTRLATIYRTVNTLRDAGILEETFLDSTGQSVYELASQEHHDHIICVDCDEIIEFQSEEIEKVQKQINASLDFEEISHRHVIYSHCLKANSI